MALHKILFYWFILMFIGAGCDVVDKHKKFEFTSPKTPFEAGTIQGTIHTRLVGTWEELGIIRTADHAPYRLVAYHAPYQLILWFSVEDVETILGCMVMLNEITLKNLDTNEFVPIPASNTASFRENSYRNTYTARVSYKNLDLGYADHSLGFSYSFDESCGMGEELVSVEMKLTKEYSEEGFALWEWFARQ